MILIVGYASESTTAHFIQFAEQKNVEFDVLDLGALDTADDVVVETSGPHLGVGIGSQWINFSKYDAIYSRAFYFEPERRERADLVSQVVSFIHAYLQHCDALVINRPSAGITNGNKLMHIIQLQDAGFTVPPAFVTSCPATVRDKVPGDGTWVSKSCSSMKTQAVAVTPTLMNEVRRLRHCPSQFQQRIVGADVRVHVVGSRVVALKIESDLLDYRFNRGPERPNIYTPVEIPRSLRSLCYQYCQRNELLFAGFDFKVPKDESAWYLLEANPMPGYEYFDRHLEGALSQALVDLLLTGRRLPRPTDNIAPFVSSDRRPTIRIR